MEDTIRNEVIDVRTISTLNTLNFDDMVDVLERALDGDDRWRQWKEDLESYEYSERVLSEVGKSIVEDDVAYKVSQLIYEGSPDRRTNSSLALDISLDNILEIEEPEEYDELLRQIRYMVIYDPILRGDGYLRGFHTTPVRNIDVLDLDEVGIEVDDMYIRKFEYNIERLRKRLMTMGIPGYLTNLIVYSSVKDPELAPSIIDVMRDEESMDLLDDIVDQIRESHPPDLNQIEHFLLDGVNHRGYIEAFRP